MISCDKGLVKVDGDLNVVIAELDVLVDAVYKDIREEYGTKEAEYLIGVSIGRHIDSFLGKDEIGSL